MQVPCNRVNCQFCAGDTSQLYCDGCHVPLGPADSGRVTLCEACVKARVLARSKGGKCMCPAGERREVVVSTAKTELLQCARCAGVIRRIR